MELLLTITKDFAGFLRGFELVKTLAKVYQSMSVATDPDKMEDPLYYIGIGIWFLFAFILLTSIAMVIIGLYAANAECMALGLWCMLAVVAIVFACYLSYKLLKHN